jgi:predicted DNA-binding transcriptional regulator YafY
MFEKRDINMEKLLKRCLDQNKLVEIIYMSESGVISQRTIKLENVSSMYIKGFCFLRNQKRTFKTANILSFRPVKYHHRKVSSY